MIALLLLLLAVADAADEPTASGRRPAPDRRERGNSMLRSGQNEVAAANFRKEIEARPNAAAAHIGLGRALMRQGRCPESLEHLLPYVGTIPFGPEAALAAAVCSRRMGWIEDALWFDYAAVELDSTHVRALTNLALDLDEAGDPAGAEAVIAQLDALKGERDPGLYVSAVLAIRHGDIDTFDVLATGWVDSGRKAAELHALRTLTWLDLGDPISAFHEMEQIRRLNKTQGQVALKSEVLRRIGRPDEARPPLEAHHLSAEGGVAVAAVWAKLAVDQGELDTAQAALAPWLDAADPDLIGARWYLARARGDEASMATLAARYAQVQESPLRTLDQLVPLTSMR